MRRAIALVAAIAMALALAPAALAATYSVDSAGDAPDADTTVAACDTGTGECTLRAAIEQANANAGADTITFTGAGRNPAPLTALPPVTGPLLIDGSGDTTTVTFGPAAAGPLLEIDAADSTIRAVVFRGGASGPVLQLDGARDRLDAVTVADAPGTGVAVNGPDARLDSPTLTGLGGTGIVAGGARLSVLQPEISGNAGHGVHLAGDGARVSGGRVHGNGGSGALLAGQNDVVTHVQFFGNAHKPIAVTGNGGIAPPQAVRVGPRRADGSLPLTGSSSGGTIELWQGDPSSAAAPGFLAAFGVPAGEFSHAFASEPAPGQQFSLNLQGGSGTSEFTSVTVPSDVTSPDLSRSRALSTSEVRVEPSEPLDPGSVQEEDFTLIMAGQPRAIESATPAADGTYVTLVSSGWRAGEAGYVELTAPGALSDSAGNASLAPTRLRVAAAPGDFIAPLGGSLRVSPKAICLTRGRGCRSTGMTIRFVTTEPGKARLVVQRGNKRIGTRLYSNVAAGPNTLKFNGILSGRKLRAGSYRLLLFVQDMVGNVTDQPPITLFSVRRVTR